MQSPFRTCWTHPRNTTRSLLLMAMLAPLSALAQSTVGDILGHVPDAAGGTVQIRHLDVGTSRETRIHPDGRFRLPALSTGPYEVRITRPDGSTAQRQVTVVAGQTTVADFATIATLETVRVQGGGVVPIDVGSVESRTTFTAEQLNTLPVGRDVTSVSLLTPGTVASSGFFGPASFGGGSAAENSYYINGFNVTNLYNSLSFVEVPFQAIDQLDVQTGGYGARYGFSTGGVTSVNVKRGTNTWKGGASWTTIPNGLRESTPDTLRTDGTLLKSFDNNRQSSDVANVWVGGPLIEDRLFVFALGSLSRSDSTSFGGRTTSSARKPGAPDTPVPPTSLSSSGQDYRSRTPYGLLKLDWYLNDRHHLEYTGFDNRRRYRYDYYDAEYSSAQPDGEPTKTDYRGRTEGRSGGSTHIFKWTGQLSDTLTASLQQGRMRNTNGVYTISPDGQRADYDGDINSPDGDCPYVVDRVLGRQVGCAVSSQMGLRNGSNQRTTGQAELVWEVGKHRLGAGYSQEDWASVQGSAYSSGAYWNLYANYAQRINFRTGGKIGVKQASWYLEDHWQATDTLMLYAGLRNDAFDNRNGGGETFVKQENIWQPRLGLSWDPAGDGDSKLFASLGRYSLPIAANVALRAATASFYTITYYTYDGYDPVTGKPNITGSYRDGSADSVVNGADGNTPDPRAVASLGLKPYTQDELILGYQRQLRSANDWLDGWTLGAKFTLRRINQVIDDTCDSRSLYNAAKAAGYDLSHWDSKWEIPGGLPGCWQYNPGSDLTLDIDVDGDGRPDRITVPASELGPKARRDYRSLTLSAEKRTERWYASASYTWATLMGNYEGLVKSTNGQDDTGTTSDFDFKELTYGADGYLFNDRRHSFKLFGSYQLGPQWQLGANLLVQSGTPISCLGGGNGTFDTEFGYRGVFHTCEVGEDDISPLGSRGRTPWTATVNPNVVYSPAALPGLSVQLSVINLFNTVTPVQVYEARYDVNAAGTVTDHFNFGKARYSTTPRYARLQVQYNW
ncbi:carboxypeptidase regulatory-like domain-containing protein [Stenotrophomonas sp. LGBM10]|uniref:TonB-dependent receptor n=1 Tax=Stenotrophomonas sp. LGBM10 TaxID=3390038 RepID=UPI00398B58F6